MSVRRSLAWMLASQGGLFVLQFGGSVVLAHLLTPYEMGVYAIAAAVIGIIGIIQSFGLTQYIIREAQADAEMIAGAFTMNVLLSVLLAIGIVGLSLFGGVLLREPGVRNVMLVLAITPLVSIFQFRPFAMLERQGQFRTIAGLTVTSTIVSTAVTLWLAFAGNSYMSIAWGAVAGSVAGTAGVMVAGRHHVSLRMSTAQWHPLLRFGMQQLMINGVSAFAGRLSDFALGRLLGLEALGLWGRANNLHNLLWFNIHGVIARVMMVALADQRRADLSLRTVYLRTVEVLTAVLWPAFSGLAILAGPFISVVYGQAWVPAAPPLAGLAMAAMVLVSLTMTPEVFIVCNETDRQVRFELIRTAVGLVLFMGGCLISLTGAALARAVEALFSNMLYRPTTERLTDTRWTDFTRVYRRSTVVTAAACGPALALMTVFHWSTAVPLVFIVPAVLTGVILWLAALKLLDHPLFEELGRFMAKGRQVVRARLSPSVG